MFMCDLCEWENYIEFMETIMNNDNFDIDIVEGIYDWVENAKHITEKQKAIIDKYINST